MALGCSPAPAPSSASPLPESSAHPRASVSAAPRAAPSAEPPAPAPATTLQLDPDGNDEVPLGPVTLPAKPRFVKVGRHWASLQRVCDFAVRDGALLMAHATRPLGFTGATLTRYSPGEKTPFSLVFDWNRPGEPETGGAGGQGFLRLRDIGGRIYVPDADPPYLGLGVAFGVEGYVFVTNEAGELPRVGGKGHRPPKAPSAERGGTLLLPGALHVFDVIRFRGKLYASTGAMVPPKATASRAPGTLFVSGDKPDRWDVAYTYDGAKGEAAVRLSYMTRFRDRLYVAVSPLYDLDRNDYVVLSPPRDATALLPEHARAVQVTASGGAHTLRWYADGGRLYWITIGADGGELRVTEDGDRWSKLALPPDVGRPTDLVRAGERLLVLAERALVELEPAGAKVLVRVEEAKSPFQLDDAYCSAPLTVFEGRFYAGDQRRGALFSLEEAN